MKLPISALILTYNEEKNIEDCLKSIYDWVEEIFIVDSYSQDNTLEVARKYTDKIYQHPFENFSQQRNWSQDNLPIKNEYVLHLDADERVSSELSSELREIFSSNVNAEGFMISRRTVFRGRWIKYGGHYPVYHLRLFKSFCYKLPLHQDTPKIGNLFRSPIFIYETSVSFTCKRIYSIICKDPSLKNIVAHEAPHDFSKYTHGFRCFR